jgi:hypothetical protein
MVVSLFRRSLTAVIFVSVSATVSGLAAQSPQTTTPLKPVVSDQPKPIAPKASPTPTPQKLDMKNLNADQVVELAIFAYGGHNGLTQVRKTTFERGRTTLTDPDGGSTSVTYQRFIIRGESTDKEKIRLDQEFPSARYSMVHSDDKIYGVYNNTVFTPREDAVRTFENQIVHGIEALLRYQENGSKLEMQPKEKILGVDYYVLDVTDKDGRQTRFYVSAKTFRVMMLTYTDNGIKYRRKYYDYKVAQGTLVAFRTVLWADEKQIEETQIGTITFGQKVDEDLFKSS